MPTALLDRQVEANGVLDTCREHGITLTAYQPLASGALTGKYMDGARPTGFRRFMRSSGQVAARRSRRSSGDPLKAHSAMHVRRLVGDRGDLGLR